MKEHFKNIIQKVTDVSISNPERMGDIIETDGYGHQYTFSVVGSGIAIQMLLNADRQDDQYVVLTLSGDIIISNIVTDKIYVIHTKRKMSDGSYDLQNRNTEAFKFDNCVIHLQQTRFEKEPYEYAYPRKHQCTENNIVYGYQGELIRFWHKLTVW